MALNTLSLCLVTLLNALLVSAASTHDVEEVHIPVLRRRATNDTVPYGTQPNNVTTLSIVLTGFEECNANSHQYGTSVDWKTWIIDGFKEHDTMSIGEWKLGQDGQEWGYPDIDWTSAPAIEFFGPGYKNNDYRDQIQNNLDQQANMDYAWFFGWRLVSRMIFLLFVVPPLTNTSQHVRCDDPASECLNKVTRTRKGSTEAYTLHHEDDQCSPYENNINFCPKYFDLPKLADALSNAAQYQGTRNNLRQYWNRACVWAHESLHVSWLGTPIASGERYMRDIVISYSWKAYRVVDTKYLSYSDGVLNWEAFNNPQNYAYFMLANYVLKKYEWYPSQNIWFSTDDPPPRPAALGVGNSTASGTVTAATSCTPLSVLGHNSTIPGTGTAASRTASVTATGTSG